MHADASPFFIGPYRFDAADDEVGPVLDRRYELVPVGGERVLGRHRLQVAGHLLGPSEVRRVWALPGAVAVTVTDQRLVWVGEGPSSPWCPAAGPSASPGTVRRCGCPA